MDTCADWRQHVAEGSCEGRDGICGRCSSWTRKHYADADYMPVPGSSGTTNETAERVAPPEGGEAGKEDGVSSEGYAPGKDDNVD
jgi:hypothetical protein